MIASEPASTTIEVLAPGLLTTIQDSRGRAHMARFGVAAAGALDPFAARAANALVGNQPDAAVLEITLAGATLRFTGLAAFAVAGADLAATLDEQPIPPGRSWLARAGATLTFNERRAGARAYLAVAGGMCVAPVLGCRSADVRAGFPGLLGRALVAGDRVPITRVPDAVVRVGRSLAPAEAPDLDQPVRVLPGPHLDRFRAGELERLCATTWRISQHADRIGYRLAGTPLEHVAAAGVPSLGLPLGAVQVPGDGQPIVLLADHQPTGGYTVLACALRADLHLLGQRAPGDAVRFALSTPAEAQSALRARHASLRALDADADVWPGVGWAM